MAGLNNRDGTFVPRAKINYGGCLVNSLILDPLKDCSDSLRENSSPGNSSNEDLPQSHKPEKIKKKRKRKNYGKKERELRKKLQLKL